MPAAARKNDPGTPHCSSYVIANGSDDVFINNQPVARVGDQSTSHLLPGSPCPSHVSSIASGSGSVFVNGRAVARVSDPLTACTVIAAGSPDVFVG